MPRISQKDAVYQVSMQVLKENNINFEAEEDVLVDVIDKDIRSTIVSILVESFIEDKIVANKKQEGKDLKRYVSALVSNWASKDPRLNGNIKHTIKKPGSRVGTTDPMIKELRNLLKQVKGTEHEIKVKRVMNDRFLTIRREQAEEVVIDQNLIPDSLKYLVNDGVVNEARENDIYDVY